MNVEVIREEMEAPTIVTDHSPRVVLIRRSRDGALEGLAIDLHLVEGAMMDMKRLP